jgi:hypothetical protein
METMTVRKNWSDDRLDGLDRKVDEGFRHVDRRFEQIDKRFERLETGIDGLRQELSAMQRSMVQFSVVFSTALAGLVVTQLGLILTQI